MNDEHNEALGNTLQNMILPMLPEGMEFLLMIKPADRTMKIMVSTNIEDRKELNKLLQHTAEQYNQFKTGLDVQEQGP